MRFIFQLCIILFISFLGELLHLLIPLPIPASIYGLVIMLLCLVTKIIKVEQVKGAGNFLLQIMPLLFVPAVVGLLDAWGELSSFLLPIAIIVPLTTVIVMASAGLVTQFVLKKGKGEEQ